MTHAPVPAGQRTGNARAFRPRPGARTDEQPSGRAGKPSFAFATSPPLRRTGAEP